VRGFRLSVVIARALQESPCGIFWLQANGAARLSCPTWTYIGWMPT
jgi:hypothetical protein